MKKLITLLFVLILAMAALVSCGEPTDTDKTVRVMVTECDGITVTSKNPVDIPIGSDAEFDVKINTGYVFDGVSCGEYDRDSGKLVVKDVTRRTRIRFEIENLGYDTSEKYTYIFENVSGYDSTDVPASTSVNAGTKITVTAGDKTGKFIGWSFGDSYDNGGEIVSYDRTFTFRLSPDDTVNGVLFVYPNYTDSNVFYYDTMGGYIDTASYNFEENSYYAAEVEGNRVKLTLYDKYLSYTECASTFFDDGTFTRPGYILKEYNTSPDGSGTAYSLGSKYYPSSSGSVLYCIWEKTTPDSSFTYKNISMEKPSSAKYADSWCESGIAITGYNDSLEKVVIPEQIGGKRVIAIEAGAFKNADFNTLVLPKTLQRVADGAFVGCSSLQTLYFPNGIYEMRDEAFDAETYSNFTRLIVNATTAPRNTTTTDGGFAVKLARLLSHPDEKRIIVISGSSTLQGLGTEYMEALFDGEYTVINFGTTRPRPGLFYLEALSHYTDEDDIFVYAPENIAYMMGEKTLSWRFIYDLEGMNNLFRYVDISNYENYFSSFTELNQNTVYQKPPKRYEQICENGYTSGTYRVTTDKYGDYQHPTREGYVGKQAYIDTYYITLNNRIKSIYDFVFNDKENQEASKDYTDPDNITWTSIDRPELVAQMNMAINKAQASGAKVYFGFAPTDADALVDEAKNREWLLAYDSLIQSLYDFDGILGSCMDYIYNHKYAYDCAYHVNNYGRTYRTYQLYLDICEKLGITEVSGIYSVGTDFSGCLFEQGSDGTPVEKVDFLQ